MDDVLQRLDSDWHYTRHFHLPKMIKVLLALFGDDDRVDSLPFCVVNFLCWDEALYVDLKNADERFTQYYERFHEKSEHRFIDNSDEVTYDENVLDELRQLEVPPILLTLQSMVMNMVELTIARYHELDVLAQQCPVVFMDKLSHIYAVFHHQLVLFMKTICQLLKKGDLTVVSKD